MTCPTGKHTYESEQAAGRALKRIRKAGPRKGAGHRKPCRAYKCEFGNHWHLTSRKTSDVHERRLR